MGYFSVKHEMICSQNRLWSQNEKEEDSQSRNKSFLYKNIDHKYKIDKSINYRLLI